MFATEGFDTKGLDTCIDALRREVVAELPDARIEEEFAGLQRAWELLDAERLRRLAEIERRRLFERDGHLSATSWLAASHRMGWGSAREQVGVARALGGMPGVRRPLDAGELSMSAVRVLAGAYQVDPEAFGRTEAQLVQAARLHTAADLQRVIATWRDRVEQARSLDVGAQRERRRLHASVTFGGMVRVDGDLDPETGETLLTALRAVLDTDARSRAHDDRRSPGQRRADGLGEICRQWLDGRDRPVVAGERPHLTVTVGVDDLRADGAGSAELDHAGPISRDAARRIACDASVMRVVMGPRSEPLDVGRRTSVVPPALRRAVIARDRHCRFPGCDRAQTWCDSHHVDHWADGGPTALPNLLLLCRRHHRMVHRSGGFGLRMEDGVAVFRRPDGTILEADRAPP